MRRWRFLGLAWDSGALRAVPWPLHGGWRGCRVAPFAHSGAGGPARGTGARMARGRHAWRAESGAMHAPSGIMRMRSALAAVPFLQKALIVAGGGSGHA